MALLAGLCLALPAAAHRAKASLTSVTWNERTLSFEIIHRIHAHDAAEAVARVSGQTTADLSDLEAQARLALYVEKHFALIPPDGEPLDLTLVGAEIEGNHVFVYQEMPLAEPPESFSVTCTFLHDIYAAQVNTVNIEIGKIVRTLVFKSGDEPKEVHIQAP